MLKYSLRLDEHVRSECPASMFSKKAGAKDLLCLKTATEAMERLLIKRFVE